MVARGLEAGFCEELAKGGDGAGGEGGEGEGDGAALPGVRAKGGVLVFPLGAKSEEDVLLERVWGEGLIAVERRWSWLGAGNAGGAWGRGGEVETVPGEVGKEPGKLGVASCEVCVEVSAVTDAYVKRSPFKEGGLHVIS